MRRVQTLAGALLALGLALTPAAAADRLTTPPGAAPVPEKAQVCLACHGEKGVPIDASIPIISGQMEGYLYLQLRDMKAGVRKVEPMEPILADLTRDDLAQLAAYFSGLPWPDIGQPRAPKDVTQRALTANESVGCTGCHLDRYQGYSAVPRLAGQSSAYLAKTIADFRSRTRANNPGMSDLMNATSQPDLDALAQFLGGL